MTHPALTRSGRRRAPATRLLPAGLALALLAGCSGATVISPNDPEYYATGAPGTPTLHYAPGERPYKPLGPGTIY